MPTDHPLFIYRYLDRSSVRTDSNNFRNRIAAQFSGGDHIAKELVVRSGIKVPRNAYDGTFNWPSFFAKASIAEVLTLVTVAIQYVSETQPHSSWPKSYCRFVETAMREEHLGLRIDDEGVVHFAVDEEFEHARLATLVGLDAPQFASARVAYEQAYRYMDAYPPDTKGAVRSAFEAVEIVAKQLCPPNKNLHVALCKGELKARCLEANKGDAVEQRVLEGVFTSMAEWVAAMHIYRHGQSDASQPPTEQFATFTLSSASGYLRLLVGVALTLGIAPQTHQAIEP